MDITPAQQALWFAQSQDPGSSRFQCAELIWLPESIDLGLFHRAVDECLAKIPELRMCFEETDGRVQRHYLPDHVPQTVLEHELITSETLTKCTAVPAMKIQGRITTEEFFSSVLFSANRAWFIRCHHLIADGFALHSLIHWVCSTYTAYLCGEPTPETPFLQPQETLENARKSPKETEAEAVEYWRKVSFDDVSTPRLIEKSAQTIPAHQRINVLADDVRSFKQACRLLKISEIDGLVYLIASYYGRMTRTMTSHPSVGLPVLNRPFGQRKINFEPAVTVAPVVIHEWEPKAVSRVVSDARRYAHLRSENIRRLHPNIDINQTITGMNINYKPFSGRFRVGSDWADQETLAIGAVEDCECIIQANDDGSWTVSVLAHLKPGTENELKRHSERIAHLIRSFDSTGHLPALVTKDEEQDLIYGRNQTRHKLGEIWKDSLSETITSARKRKIPRLWYEGVWLSEEEVAAEIDCATAVIKRSVEECGAGSDAIVAIELDRCPGFWFSVTACAQLGLTWLPVPRELPKQRRETMKNLARSTITIGCDDESIIRISEHSRKPWTSAFGLKSAASSYHKQGKDAAYILFTSGSTGTPKGVVNTNQGIINRLAWMAEDVELDPTKDRLIQKTTASFDVSVWEFILPVVTGTDVAIAGKNSHRDPDLLGREVHAAEVTIVHMVPSALEVFINSPQFVDGLQTVRKIICSGESLNPKLAQESERLLGAKIHNYYGPTEAAIDVTVHVVDGTEQHMPIGKPVWNTQCYILDECGQPLPDGVIGKLFIGGHQVAQGYLGQAELSAEKFLPDPFFPGKMYDTGDLAYWSSNRRIGGSTEPEIYYVSRSDDQIKLRGQRLELGEVENTLRALNSVQAAVVAVRNDQLVAYVLSDEKNLTEVKAALRQRLPEYMLPAAWVVLDEMPLKSNGKIDRGQLPDPRPTAASEKPLDEQEALVVQIASQLLGVALTPHSNFFASGGNSLKAVQLIQEIAKRTGSSISVANVFASPTIRGITKLISLPNLRVDGYGQVLEISSPRASTVHLVCVHPAGGVGWAYAPILNYLSSDTRVSIVQSPLLSGKPGPASIREAAQQAIESLKLDSCAERLVLLGWSVGGVIAQEMAVQLYSSGIVSLQVLILDAYPGELWRGRPEPTQDEVLRGLTTMAGIDLPAEITLSEATVIARLKQSEGPFSTFDVDRIGFVVQSIRQYAQIMREHRTRYFPGKVILVQASKNPEHMEPRAWDPYVSALEIMPLAITHPELVSQENLRIVASCISQLAEEKYI